MASKRELLNEIRAALGPAVSPSLTTRSKGCDIYEAYLFALVLESAQQEDARRIAFENVDGSTGSTVTFRTTPMKIQTRKRPYSHAVIGFDGKPALELHVGIFLNRGSKVAHESDVVVLDRAESLACRSNPQSEIVPRSGKALLTIEAKFYSSQLKLGLGRNFLGLCTDYAVRDSFLVTNTASDSVAALLAGRKCKFVPQVDPRMPSQVDRLRGLLRTVFFNYKARR